jgi:hypothetical protein
MKYRKKPIVIEAEQFFPEQMPWPDGVYSSSTPGNTKSYVVCTLEGNMNVTPGDWIITGVKGERYPCKPDIFDMTYEKVEE